MDGEAATFIPSLLVQQSLYVQAVGRRPQVGKPGAPQTPKGRTTETSSPLMPYPGFQVVFVPQPTCGGAPPPAAV